MIIISGASNPPKAIHFSSRRSKSGVFLAGISHDLANVEDAIGCQLYNTVRDLYLTKSAALRHIEKLFERCRYEELQPTLYFTGHGKTDTGNWCFADGTISIEEILHMVPRRTYYPMIYSNACYSGHWKNFCVKKNIPGFQCLAACPEYCTAFDTKDAFGYHYFSM